MIDNTINGRTHEEIKRGAGTMLRGKVFRMPI